MANLESLRFLKQLLPKWVEKPLSEFWYTEKLSHRMILWDIYSSYIKAVSSFFHLIKEQDIHFKEIGVKQGVLPFDQVTKFVKALESAQSIAASQKDYLKGYISNPKTYLYTDDINKSHSFLKLNSAQLQLLQPMLNDLAQPVASCIGSPWRVVNIRCWKTYPNAVERGPNEWHKDGFHPAVLKIMVYLSGAGPDIGSTEIVLENGSKTIIEGPLGCWVIFKNSDLLHRGIAPKYAERLVLEITMMPALTYELIPVCAGINAQYPKIPWSRPQSFEKNKISLVVVKIKALLRKMLDKFHALVLKKFVKITALNIGGGPTFHKLGWLNLEGVESKENPSPFYLSRDCIFPLKSCSLSLVYTSHCLEHLDTPTVKRALSESHRVLKSNGQLLVKIPDFDRALNCWRHNTADFFTDEFWGTNVVTPTWASRGIKDCLDYRASMLFCGFWNDEYGDHFSGRILQNKLAYHGPAVVSVDFLHELIKDHTPSQISAFLRKTVIENEPSVHFNHQNAWSQQEFSALLDEAGFKIKSVDKMEIISKFKTIPDIKLMEEQSSYYLAVKK